MWTSRATSAPSKVARSDPLNVSAQCHSGGMPVTIADVRAVAEGLPRSYEAIVRDRVKFRVGSIVWLAFNQAETEMGFAFPKEERAALVASEPDVFFLPRPSDMRFNWVECRMDQLDEDRMRELVLDAWRMVVPKKLWPHAGD